MDSDRRPTLIIDDDSLTRYLIARLVRHSGQRAVGASTLAAGLALLETQPGCVIVDLNLPDGRGEAVIRAVRERRMPCRVVVCSGVADPRRIAELEKLGADAVLAKPVAPEEFIRACRGDDSEPSLFETANSFAPSHASGGRRATELAPGLTGRFVRRVTSDGEPRTAAPWPTETRTRTPVGRPPKR